MSNNYQNHNNNNNRQDRRDKPVQRLREKTKLPQLLKPLECSVTSLFNASVEESVTFEAKIRKGSSEVELGYIPPIDGNKEEVYFKARQ